MVEENKSGAYTQFVYSPTGFKMEIMNGGNLVTAFSPLPAGTMRIYEAGGFVYYRHSDWLGSSRLASTTSRTVYYDGAYGPFGEPYAGSGTTDLNFTGMDQTIGNTYDFPAREYGIQGRWPSPDPAGLAAVNPMDPQTWNRYAYVRNSPLELVDPLGLDSCGAIVCIIVDPPPPPPSDPCDLPGVCDAPPGSPNPGGPQGGGSNGTSSSPSHPAPLAPCSLSIGQRVSLGIQGTLNAAIASKKAAGGLLIGAAGVGLGPFSDGTSLFGTAVGSYMVTTAAGQGLVAANQLNQAYTGQGGPENQTQRLGILLSGPISSSVVLASNGSVATAERMAKYESIGTNGIGIFSSSTVSELLETSADAVLSTLGIHDLGTCAGD